MKDRNSPCPCGSGKKYKKCCLLAEHPPSPIITKSEETRKYNPTLRIKGGVRYEPESNGYLAMVHMWDNADCHGDPKEITHPQVFETEDEAMDFYKTKLRPSLESLKTSNATRSFIRSVDHRKLEE